MARTEAHERDRRRLKAALEGRRFYRTRAEFSAETHAHDTLDSLDARYRDRARCKRAGKLAQEHWLTLKILGGMHDQVVKNWMESLDELCMTTIERNQWEVRAQRDRRRLRRVLGAAKEDRRNYRAWEYTAIFVLDVLNEAYRREDELEAERDELRERACIYERHKERAEVVAGKLHKECDELRAQLKAVTDCIIHYAPSDFTILRYDSPAEALSALLGGEDNDEETVTQNTTATGND